METNIDRISELPDALIFHIFSLLESIEDVKETCMLSKRWRNLWLSSPTLRIYDTHISDDGDDFVTFNRFINFVDRLLLLRDTSSDIRTLKLRWNNITVFLDQLELKYDVSGRIATWIMAAVKHNVQELNLLLCLNQMVKLPDCLFTCKSLTKLKFTGFGRELTDFVLPSISTCLPRLRYLALTGVSLGDDNLATKLLSSCPVLESLRLVNCSMKFDISSLSLKHFELDNHDTYESSDDYANTVKLSAPNLTSLIFKDYMSQDYTLDNLSSLVTADIGMIVENTDGYTPETPETYSKLATEVKELYGTRMINFLRAVHNVTDLTLSSSPGFLEVVSGSLDLLDDLSIQFFNLRSLMVETWVSRNCMNAIAYLVKISPNIESISVGIVKTELNTNNTGGDWIVGSSFPCLPYLKSVEIKGIQGCLNELKFLQVLLKKAVVLEQVTLICYKTDSSDRAAQLLEFKEMLLAFPSASSSVAISIQS